MFQGIKHALAKKYTYINNNITTLTETAGSPWGVAAWYVPATIGKLNEFLNNILTDSGGHTSYYQGQPGVQDSLWVHCHQTLVIKNTTLARIDANVSVVTPKYDLAANVPVSGGWPNSDLLPSGWTSPWSYSGAGGSDQTLVSNIFNKELEFKYPASCYNKCSKRKTIRLAPGQEIKMNYNTFRHFPLYTIYNASATSFRALKNFSVAFQVRVNSELGQQGSLPHTAYCEAAIILGCRYTARYYQYATPQKIFTDTSATTIATTTTSAASAVGGAFAGNTITSL